MEHITLLVVILAVIVVGIALLVKRNSKVDPLDENPMRGTTRRGPS